MRKESAGEDTLEAIGRGIDMRTEDYLAVTPSAHKMLGRVVAENMFWNQWLYSREGLEHLFPGLRRKS